MRFTASALVRPAAALSAALAIASCSAPDPVEAAPEFPADGYELYTGSEDAAGTLSLCFTTLVHPASGKVVELIPMIHLADAAFYREAQAEMDRADVALLEGIGHAPAIHPTHFLLTYLFANYLRFASHGGLVHQHEGIAWRDNQESGDLDAAAIRAQMPWWTPAVHTVLLPPIAVLFETWNLLSWLGHSGYAAVGAAPAAEAGYRHDFALLLTDGDDEGDGSLLPGVRETRNEHLIAELDEAAARADVNRIALPWGAAHMPGLERDLEARGYRIAERRWVSAWQVAGHRDEGGDRPFDVMVPYALQWRSFQGHRTLDLALHSITVERGGDAAWGASLLWDLILTASWNNPGGDAHLQLLPSFFDRPLLFAWSRRGDSSRWRFLWFFDIGP